MAAGGIGPPLSVCARGTRSSGSRARASTYVSPRTATTALTVGAVSLARSLLALARQASTSAHATIASRPSAIAGLDLPTLLCTLLRQWSSLARSKDGGEKKLGREVVRPKSRLTLSWIRPFLLDVKIPQGDHHLSNSV